VPHTLQAQGNVTARQGDRLVKASEQLDVTFEMVTRPPPPFDAAAAYNDAVKQGLDLRTIDWEAKRREHENAIRTEPGVAHFHAVGDVFIDDPAQPLELTAREVDCTVTDGRDIDKARVHGTEDNPANVKMDTFTVTGQKIRVDAANQWAEVPGAGRLTFRSMRDLDGSQATEPVPVAVTWNEWMKYHGRENRSVFQGRVHATSRTATTFDCDRLVVDFDDAPPPATSDEPGQDWWILQGLVDQLSDAAWPEDTAPTHQRFRKEPTHVLAVGHAVAQTARTDESSGDIDQRATIRGPKLSVNLRSNVSKMLIEGPGSLLLEDYRAPTPQERASRTQQGAGLFDVNAGTGPSNTLIEWADMMWYDFSIDQTRFEGDVNLTHFSGAELMRVRGGSTLAGAQPPPGRRTFLACDVLVVDFLQRDQRGSSSQDHRMGRLGAALLQHFAAEGAVQLEDTGEGISLGAGRVVYERDRRLLAVYGSPSKNAQIILQRPGRLPTQFSAERFFYDVEKDQIEQVVKPSLRSR
jgi:hypothetical protein